MPVFGYWPAFVGCFFLQKSARFAAKSKPGFFVTVKPKNGCLSGFSGIFGALKFTKKWGEHVLQSPEFTKRWVFLQKSPPRKTQKSGRRRSISEPAAAFWLQKVEGTFL